MGGPRPRQRPVLGAAWASEARAAPRGSWSRRRACALWYTPGRVASWHTCQLPGTSHRDGRAGSGGVWGAGLHRAFPQQTQRKGVFASSSWSLFLFFFFLLTVWYVLVCYFVHPCDCHFINSCAFCIFHMIKIVSRVITIYTVVLVTLRTYLHITGH